VSGCRRGTATFIGTGLVRQKRLPTGDAEASPSRETRSRVSRISL
jgi:hypothetical protein